MTVEHQARAAAGALEAADDVLVRRYEGTRRRHPIDARGVEESIADELIVRLGEVRGWLSERDALRFPAGQRRRRLRLRPRRPRR